MASTSRLVMDVAHEREEKKTRRRKRTATQEPPAPPAPKRKRAEKSASRRGEVKRKESADATPLTHERILRNIYVPKLLRLLAEFLCRRCRLLPDLPPEAPPYWLREVDANLSWFGAQRRPFICPGTVVFLYMVCRDTVSAEVSSMEELRAVLLTCMYVSCAYTGHSLGYPVFPFLGGNDRQEFWKRTLDITMRLSQKMLLLNTSPQFFAQVFTDLKKGTDL